MKSCLTALGALFICLVVASRLWAHGDLHQRIEAATREIETATNKAPAYLRRGDLHRQHQDWEAAQSDFQHATALDPKLVQVNLCRGRLLSDMGKFSEAKAALDQYLSSQSNDGEAYVVRARVCLKLGQAAAAAADFGRAIRLLPDPQPDYFLERAQALAADNQLEEAVQGLDEGLKRLGPLVTLQQAAIDLEIRLQHYDPALTRLETILARVSRKEIWLARQGEILQLAGRENEARSSFASALTAIEALPPRFRESQPIVELKRQMLHKLGIKEQRSDASNK